MGNSTWTETIPYRDDVVGAIRALRQKVFASRAYYKGYKYADDVWPQSPEELVWRTGYRTHSILDIGWVGTLSEHADSDTEPKREDLLRSIMSSRPGQPCICLDCQAVPEDVIRRNAVTIFPLSRGERIVLFGTTKPTRWDIIEAEQYNLFDHVPAIYVVVYEDLGRLTNEGAQPDELYCYGSTGGGP